jgi:hypothetical protein
MTFNQIAQQLSFKMKGAYTNSGGSLAYAKRIARTEGHRIQCQAGMDACYKAKDRGADVVKQWDSTLDAKTRNSHVAVDQEVRELDEKFSNSLMFPGDPSGRASEVINCRCALLQRARWAVGNSFTKMNNFTKQIESFESPEDYAEFKKAFFSKENRNYMNYTEQMREKYGTKDFRVLLDKMDDREYNHLKKLQEGNPLFNKKANSAKTLTNTAKSDRMQLPDIQIARSVGAKALNYEVLDFETGMMFRFVEGTRLQNVEVFAGKGSSSPYRNAYKYANAHGGKLEDWQHVKGTGWLETDDGDRHAEVHWSQCEGIGKFDFFVKRWLD